MVISLLALVAPDVMSTLWTEPEGLALLAVAVTLQVIGFIAIRRIVAIDI